MQATAGLAAAGVLTAALLCSCSAMTLAPGAEAIVLTTNPEDVQNCTAAGYIRVSDSVMNSDVATSMRNQALAFAADRVLLLDNWQNAVAYRCSGHVASGENVSVAKVPAAVPAQSTSAPVAVSAAKAERGDIDWRIAALGTVTPVSTVTVRAQVSGQLQQLALREGQWVHAGDFLAQIEPATYQTALDQAQGLLRRDQALLAGARLELKHAVPQQAELQLAKVQQYMGSVDADEPRSPLPS